MSDGGMLGEDQSTRLTRTIGAATGWLGSFPAILTAAYEARSRRPLVSARGRRRAHH